MANMKALMERLRAEPLLDIAGTKVLRQLDYQDGSVRDYEADTVEDADLQGSNVLKYHLADGTHLVIRPSGTEPKVKVYLLLHDDDRSACKERMTRFTQ